MNRLTSVWRRLMLFIQRDRAARDLEDEMRLHRDLRAETLREQGMSPDEARSAAARRFGNAMITVETSRDQWGWSSLDDLVQDARYAARRLRQRPAFTASVVGVLVLGVGATTAMFSAVDAALLRPLPFPRSEELLAVDVQVPFDRPYRPIPENERVPDLTDVLSMRETFSHVAAYASGGLNLSEPGRPIRTKAGVVTHQFFATLGVLPSLGRAFDSTEALAGASRTVILSWPLWQRHYGGRPMIDSTIPLNNRRYTVIGIMPRGFAFPDASDLWIPMSVPTTSRTFEAFRGFLSSTAIVRLAPGVTRDAAAARFTARWDRFVGGFPKSDGKSWSEIERMSRAIRESGGLTQLRAELVGDRKRSLLVLFGATALLLIIACTNVTSLLLAHGASRRRELAVRGVLGATRARIVRQLLAESVLISVAGTAGGIAVAPVALKLIAALMPPNMAGLASATVDARVLAFAAILALVTGIAFGLWPAVGATRASVASTIKAGGGHGGSAGGARRLQQILVGGELALTLMLLVGAGLMLRSFSKLMDIDPGLSAERIATMELSFPRVAGSDRFHQAEAMVQRLKAVPGISAAAVVNDLPLSGSGGVAISVSVPNRSVTDDFQFARRLVASEDYFNVMGIHLLQGRTFARTDDATAPRVAIINDVFARKYWPDGDGVGRTFSVGGDSAPTTVIGIVAHVRESGLDHAPGPQMYFPARRSLGENMAIVARGTLSPREMLAQLRGALQAVDRAQAITTLRMMDEVVGKSMETRRANTMLITLFGAVALAVSIFGVYAVTANAVAQRNREFGIRSALGASRGDLLREAGVSMGWIAIAGIGAGVGLAWATSKVVATLLYSITVHDALTFAIAPVALLVAVIFATLVPARRALRANPVDVMRDD